MESHIFESLATLKINTIHVNLSNTMIWIEYKIIFIALTSNHHVSHVGIVKVVIKN